MSAGKVIVYGGRGALGSVVVKHFKANNFVSIIIRLEVLLLEDRVSIPLQVACCMLSIGCQDRFHFIFRYRNTHCHGLWKVAGVGIVIHHLLTSLSVFHIVIHAAFTPRPVSSPHYHGFCHHASLDNTGSIEVITPLFSVVTMCVCLASVIL